MFLQFLTNGLIIGILYGLVAIGFSLVYNTTRIFHIAAAALYVVAAYAFYFSFLVLNLPLWLSGLCALVTTALLSVLIEITVYRPLYNKKSSLNVVMIASIGVMIILINIIALLFGNESKILDNSIQKVYHHVGVIITTPQLLQLIIGGIIILAFVFFSRFSKFGLKTRALSNNDELFAVMGFSIQNTRLWVFALSGVFLALGSCLSAYDVGMTPHIGMPILVNAMVAMIIGGVGRFDACVIGGLTLGLLQSLVVYQFSANWQNAITFLVLLIFLFFRPQGILGYKKRMA